MPGLEQLAEALLTLANLTADEQKREELYARAQTEGGELLQLELDPPPTALPASISSIAATARPTPILRHDLPGGNVMAIEASPSLIFASGTGAMKSAASMFAREFGRTDVGVGASGGGEQPMVVDVRKDDSSMRMDES